MLKRLLALALAASFASTAHAEEIGRIGVDWIGNDIIIEAFTDPKVEGVTCHITHFDRSLMDRVINGSWFENPSNSAISCNQTGPIFVGDIVLAAKGEEVFKQDMSLIWKELVVTRFYDKKNDTLVYLTSSKKAVQGSAKMAIATVPLYNQSVQWQKGRP
jgi:CreA protein